MISDAKLENPLWSLVVEDEWPARAYLIELLEASGVARVAAAVATLAEARQVLGAENMAIDVTFVDINLAKSGGEGAGITFVRSIAALSEAPAVVFTTAYRQYAVEAFELGAVDYLLKPFTEERLYRCLMKVKQQRSSGLTSTTRRRVVARSKQGLVFLATADVFAFEASSRLTFVHTKEGRFDVDLSLNALESAFDSQFVRVHRNWLVNIERVVAMNRDTGETVLVVGGRATVDTDAFFIPVAKDRVADVRRRLLIDTTGIRCR